MGLGEAKLSSAMPGLTRGGRPEARQGPAGHGNQACNQEVARPGLGNITENMIIVNSLMTDM